MILQPEKYLPYSPDTFYAQLEEPYKQAALYLQACECKECAGSKVAVTGLGSLGFGTYTIETIHDWNANIPRTLSQCPLGQSGRVDLLFSGFDGRYLVEFSRDRVKRPTGNRNGLRVNSYFPDDTPESSALDISLGILRSVADLANLRDSNPDEYKGLLLQWRIQSVIDKYDLKKKLRIFRGDRYRTYAMNYDPILQRTAIWYSDTLTSTTLFYEREFGMYELTGACKTQPRSSNILIDRLTASSEQKVECSQCANFILQVLLRERDLDGFDFEN